MKPGLSLALFFTRNMSLKAWVDSGLFEREKLLYEGMLIRGHVKSVVWLTYGSGDADLARQLIQQGRLHAGITVCPMPAAFADSKWLQIWYSLVMPWFWRDLLRSVSLFKTNQMDGSWTAVIAHWLYDRPLVLRCGYSLSQLIGQNSNTGWLKRQLINAVEHLAYRYCDVAMVSSQHSLAYLLTKYPINPARCFVVNNGIDIQLFKPRKQTRIFDRLLFVGRLHAEKNLLALIEACATLGLGLDIYGAGPLKSDLQTAAAKSNVAVCFKGVVSNADLATVYNQYGYYVLPSFHEGMPKTLLEAMACGCLCVGTDVNGINEVITDGVNGVLAKSPNSEDLAEAIRRAQQLDFSQLSRQATAHIRTHYAFSALIEKEADILRNLSKPPAVELRRE